MVHDILVNVVSPFFGTIAYAVLFNVPKQYYLSGGMTGLAGWLVYKAVCAYGSPAVAAFFGTLIVVLISRMLTVLMKCPITIFLVSGIIPMVPGAGIYYTAYYLVTSQLSLAAQKGLESVKIAFAIVLGIVCIVSIPREFFQRAYWKRRKLRKG